MKDILFEQPYFLKGPKNLAFVHYTDMPGIYGKIESHWHAAVEMTLTLENSILIYSGGKVTEYAPGDVTLVNSGIVHVTEVKEPEQEVRCLVILISDDMFRSIKPDFDRYRFEIPQSHPQKSEIIRSLQNIYHAYVVSPSKFSTALIHAELWKIVYLLLQNFCVPKEVKAIAGEEQKHYLARQAINYIEQNFRGNITLDETANAVGLQKNYFCRYFKKYTGMSFTQYLAKTRLRYALAYLTDFDSSVTESALQAGFPSVTAFTEVCKREYGVTPLQYKKQNE